jgi:hypothetical protein
MRRLLPHPNLGVLLSPGCGNKPIDDVPWAIDNGAFSGFDEKKWLALLERLEVNNDCIFAVVPDAVGDHVATRLLWRRYSGTARKYGFPLAYVLQDGQRCEEIPWEEIKAIFVGGTTAYKESQEVVRLIAEAKRRGKWVHMGRVNTMRRVRFAITAGVDSIDGSQFSWFSETYIPKFLAMLSSQQGELQICNTH